MDTPYFAVQHGQGSAEYPAGDTSHWRQDAREVHVILVIVGDRLAFHPSHSQTTPRAVNNGFGFIRI
jgi:hypothetical protein